jgi:hypothetical protein
MEQMTSDAARMRIQVHYIEMPGLRLSRAQASRLCGVSADLCADALTTLVKSGFLSQSIDGSFVRCGLQRSDWNLGLLSDG